METETARLHALLDGMVVQLLARPPRLSPLAAHEVLTAHLRAVVSRKQPDPLQTSEGHHGGVTSRCHLQSR
ncbi:TetR family transcriptional regulator C-terminal domain-containing protein [Catenulispora subtropica]|uniref:TetR family transcriptional regulator C-terminal domain-containing protein n=1 Tax=Catenulispora subtropica TaxID=450798 RepID=UPI003CD0B12A